MELPDEVRKCVAFVAADKGGVKEERGTAFFVVQRLGEGPEAAPAGFTVTARHVIEGIKARGCEVYLRLNTLKKSAEYVMAPLDKWVMHPNPQIDLAVTPWAPDREYYDHLAIPEKMFVAHGHSHEWKIGPGCDIFFPGLFVHLVGQEQNIPIIRTGAIAAMPSEPVRTEHHFAPAYIAEARSIGGLSGSPVFAYQQLSAGRLHFLGVLLAHWDDPGVVIREVNMGLSVVAPSDDVRVAISDPVFDGYRDEVRREWDDYHRRHAAKSD